MFVATNIWLTLPSSCYECYHKCWAKGIITQRNQQIHYIIKIYFKIHTFTEKQALDDVENIK